MIVRCPDCSRHVRRVTLTVAARLTDELVGYEVDGSVDPVVVPVTLAPTPTLAGSVLVTSIVEATALALDADELREARGRRPLYEVHRCRR